jgi:hypothetical protein
MRAGKKSALLLPSRFIVPVIVRKNPFENKVSRHPTMVLAAMFFVLW